MSVNVCVASWVTAGVFLHFRFPPFSPLKSYPKQSSYRKEIVKFPNWNYLEMDTFQERIPVKPIMLVRFLPLRILIYIRTNIYIRNIHNNIQYTEQIL